MKNNAPLKTKTKLGAFIRDPGFLFNTGYLGTFSALIPMIGPVPFIMMALNWLAGVFIVSYKKNLCPDFIKNKITKTIQGGMLSRFLSRDNASLATNGGILLLTGVTTLVLTMTQNYGSFSQSLALPIWQILTTTLTNKVALSSIVALGFGIGNLKKASELDGVPSSIGKIFPFLNNFKSEFVVAVSTMCLCLMTGGWSLLAAPVILFSLKQGQDDASKADSKTYKFTQWLGSSSYSYLPISIKNNLLDKHPLAISRGAISLSLVISVLIGLSKVFIRSIAAGAVIVQSSDLSTLGNMGFALANFRLYQITDIAMGALPKGPSLPGHYKATDHKPKDQLA